MQTTVCQKSSSKQNFNAFLNVATKKKKSVVHNPDCPADEEGLIYKGLLVRGFALSKNGANMGTNNDARVSVCVRLAAELCRDGICFNESVE